MRPFRLKMWTTVVMTVAVIGAGALTAAGYAGETRRVSTDSSGHEANAGSAAAALSGDGRYVAFYSTASNLAAPDTNSMQNVFLKDRTTNATTLVSRGYDGSPANANSLNPVVSKEGNAVAFQSTASNLVAGETGLQLDVFVKDMTSGETTRVSSSSAGLQGNGYSRNASISSTGALVAFESVANNLVSDDTNATWDIFVRNLVSGETTRVSTSSNGAQGNNGSYSPSISADGKYVAFASDAFKLVSEETTAQEASDIFVKDMTSGETTRVSCSATKVEANGGSWYPSISDTGRYVAFESDASNLVVGDTNDTRDVFFKDLLTGSITRVSHSTTGGDADDLSSSASISGDGQYVVFQSAATNLVSGDTNDFTDVFIWSRATGKIVRVSSDSNALQANGASGSPALSADGRFVGFDSLASNLVSGDSNGNIDVFVNEVDVRPTASVGAPSKPATVYTWAPFTSTGTITRHTGVTSVTIECFRSRTASSPVYRYSAYTTSGGTTYSNSAVRLPSAGYWYLRAKHTDTIHRTSYSAWTTVYVTSAPVITAPKVPTSMYASHTYSVYGTIKPRHTASTYIVVNAYKLVGSSYVYKTHFHVKITNTGQAYNTTKYIAAVKLTSKGYWKLRVKHSAHGVEGALYSAYSARFKVR